MTALARPAPPAEHTTFRHPQLHAECALAYRRSAGWHVVEFTPPPAEAMDGLAETHRFADEGEAVEEFQRLWDKVRADGFQPV